MFFLFLLRVKNDHNVMVFTSQEPSVQLVFDWKFDTLIFLGISVCVLGCLKNLGAREGTLSTSVLGFKNLMSSFYESLRQ